MLIIRNGANPAPELWWVGVKIECPKCIQVVQLEKGDQDRASMTFHQGKYGRYLIYQCENCRNDILKREFE